MHVIIRTYITNEKRLEYLKRTIQSCIDKEMFPITIVDNMSPPEWARRIEELGKMCGFIRFVRSELCSSTMNGFIASLLVAPEMESCLYLEDDVVLGKGIKEYLTSTDMPTFTSLYAVYNRFPKNVGDPLWEYPIEAFYGLIAIVINPSGRAALLNEWKTLSYCNAYPQWHADIWLKEFCKKYGYKIWNTVQDYAQHVGNEVRSINEGKIDSVYESRHFIGE